MENYYRAAHALDDYMPHALCVLGNEGYTCLPLSLRLLFFVLFIKFVSASTDIWFIEGGNNRMLEKVHNEELHDLYSVPDIIRVMELISLLAFDGMNSKACCN